MTCLPAMGYYLTMNLLSEEKRFVTRKISRAVAQIHLWLQDKLYIGNLDAQRDRGHAKDYVQGMWLMLQQDKAQDYVLATWETTSVRDFITLSFKQVGIEIIREGSGIHEVGKNKLTGEILVEVDEKYFRPSEVDLLLGNPAKAKKELGRQHHYNLEQLCQEMVNSDIRSLQKTKDTQRTWFYDHQRKIQVIKRETLQLSFILPIHMNKKIVVVGDVILDEYHLGNIKRLNPESPAPLFSINKTEYRLGGAANVAANIVGLWWGDCTLIGNQGKDIRAEIIESMSEKQNIDFIPMPTTSYYS
jgi:hypothetical protein